MRVRLCFPILLLMLVALVVGCGTLKLEGSFMQPAEATATAQAILTPTPTPAPRLGKVVFLRGGDIWVSDLDTGRETRLTEGGGNEYPRWSTSGQWVAFLQERTLWVVSAEGGFPLRVSDVAAENASWSPVADQLAYVTVSGGLRVADAEGKEQRELMGGSGVEGAGVGAIAWSPDGQWLAFEWTETAAGGLPSYQSLRRIRADGTGLGEIYSAYQGTEEAETVALVGWSPDSSRLAFWQIPDGSASLGADGVPLLVVPAVGGSPTPIAEAVLPHRDFVAWSPDGERLAVVTGAGRETWFNKTLMAISADGHSAQPLSSPADAAISPAWAPDGLHLAYVSAPAVAGVAGGDAAVLALAARRIRTVQPGGQGREQLAGDSQFREEWPQWSASGDSILFVQLHGQPPNLQVDLVLLQVGAISQETVAQGIGPVTNYVYVGDYGYTDWAKFLDWWTPGPSVEVAKATPATPFPSPERATATALPKTAKPATRTPTPLAPAATAESSWRLILFSYNHGGASEIWTIDPGRGYSAGGAAERQIRPHDVVHYPAMSPLGDTIAYIHVADAPSPTISGAIGLWLMDRDGSDPRPLYVPEEGGLQRLAWRPDGQAIYFQGSGTGISDSLFRIPIEGGEPVAILNDCLDFALSPDGERLVSMTQDGRLLLSDGNGADVREIEPKAGSLADYGLFAFSPDGRRLAFRGSTSGRDTWNLYIMDLSDLEVHRLTDLTSFDPFTSSSGQVNGLAWTADGTRLIYSVDGHPEQAGIWAIDSEGGERHRLFVWDEGEWAAVMGPWFDE
jgi:Tol biopolymer transport system component